MAKGLMNLLEPTLQKIDSGSCIVLYYRNISVAERSLPIISFSNQRSCLE